MSFVGWIIIGLVAAFVANRLVGRGRDILIYQTMLGIIGAVVAGSLFQIVAGNAADRLEIRDMLFAATGATFTLAASELLRDWRAARAG
jgi:uncharacterized membrane protein YeaQ/YmgE (transglycosylase-associated protein family)